MFCISTLYHSKSSENCVYSIPVARVNNMIDTESETGLIDLNENITFVPGSEVCSCGISPLCAVLVLSVEVYHSILAYAW